MNYKRKAICRYGMNSYPMTLIDFPEAPGDLEGVKKALRMNKPGFKAIEDTTISERRAIPGLCEAATIYHTPGFEMFIEYSEA